MEEHCGANRFVNPGASWATRLTSALVDGSLSLTSIPHVLPEPITIFLRENSEYFVISFDGKIVAEVSPVWMSQSVMMTRGTEPMVAAKLKPTWIAGSVSTQIRRWSSLHIALLQFGHQVAYGTCVKLCISNSWYVSLGILDTFAFLHGSWAPSRACGKSALGSSDFPPQSESPVHYSVSGRWPSLRQSSSCRV